MSVVTERNGTLEYLTAEGLTVPHCFTTRMGGVSTGYLSSLNIGMHRGDLRENVEENFRILAETIGFQPRNLVLSHQIHTDIIRTVTKSDSWGVDHHEYPQCDGLITNDPGTALVIFTADCTPILLQDPITGAVGAIHAGWRSTAADIAGKAVAAMVKEFGCDPKNIQAAIGPNLGACCFETDRDVPDAIQNTFGPKVEEYIRPAGEKFFVDLKAINAYALRRAGVENIEISTECTMCLHEKYWSHRYTRGVRGSQGAIIVCQEVQP